MPQRTELEAFLRHLLPWQVKPLEPAAACATDWPELRDLRTHAAWTWMREPYLARVFGMRRLPDRAPPSLAHLDWAVLRAGPSPESPESPKSDAPEMEHYLVLELFAPDSARLYLCLHAPPAEWFVLDAHVLRQSTSWTSTAEPDADETPSVHS